MNNLYKSLPKKSYIVKNTPNVFLLNSLGIFEGSKITKKHTYKLGGPVIVEINLRDIAIGKDLANLIEVEDFIGG